MDILNINICINVCLETLQIYYFILHSFQFIGISSILKKIKTLNSMNGHKDDRAHRWATPAPPRKSFVSQRFVLGATSPPQNCGEQPELQKGYNWLWG